MPERGGPTGQCGLSRVRQGLTEETGIELQSPLHWSVSGKNLCVLVQQMPLEYYNLVLLGENT